MPTDERRVWHAGIIVCVEVATSLGELQEASMRHSSAAWRRVSEGDYWRRPGEAVETQTLSTVVAKECRIGCQKESWACPKRGAVWIAVEYFCLAIELVYPCSSRCRTISAFRLSSRLASSRSSLTIITTPTPPPPEQRIA